MPRAYHRGEVVVEERPQDGPGRPSQTRPRVVQALRYGLQATRHARAEVSARQRHETGGCGLLTHVPPGGERAPRAGDVRRADQEPQGSEQHCGCLTDPRMVNRLFLKTPERLEALGRV